MLLLILIVLLLIFVKMPSKTASTPKRQPSMTAAQRELSAKWAAERAQQNRTAALRKNIERSHLLEDVGRLLAPVDDLWLADALGGSTSMPRTALIERAARRGRDGAWALTTAYREVA